MYEIDDRDLEIVSGGVAAAAVATGFPSGVVHGAATTGFYENPTGSGGLCYGSIYDYSAVMRCISVE